MKKSEEKKYNLQSNNDTSLSGVALHSVCLGETSNKSDSSSLSEESEYISDSSFLSQSDLKRLRRILRSEPHIQDISQDADTFIQKNPLYKSSIWMQNCIPQDINIESINKNNNYVGNIKYNIEQPNGPNIYLITEAQKILSQATYGKLLFFASTAPTKISTRKRDSILANYSFISGLLSKIKEIAKNRTDHEFITQSDKDLIDLLLESKYIDEDEFIYLLYHADLLAQYFDANNPEHIEGMMHLFKQYGNPDPDIYTSYLNKFDKQITSDYLNAEKKLEFLKKYDDIFKLLPYGIHHDHFFAQDINWSLLGNYEKKYINGSILYIIPIKYTYFGQLRHSKIEICIQPIDKDRYDDQTQSTRNLLNYFCGPQNQPTTYWKKQTFSKFNADSNYKHLSQSEETITIKNKNNQDEQITFVKVTQKPISAYSDQIPKFNLPNSTIEYTIFDFWPELHNLLDKLFPNVQPNFLKTQSCQTTPYYIIDSIIYSARDYLFNSNKSNASYNNFYTEHFDNSESQKLSESENIPEYAFTDFLFRQPEIVEKSKHSFIFLATQLLINSYEYFKLFKTNTENYVDSFNKNRRSFEYDIDSSTIPSVSTLYRILESSNIPENPENPVYEDPKLYWRLIRRVDDNFETPLSHQDYQTLLSQHNESCLEALRTLQNQNSLSTNINYHIQLESRLNRVLEPLNAKLKNYDFFTPDCLSSRLTLFSQIYQISHFSSFSLISHKNYQITLNLHQNYLIPYIDTS